MDSAKANSLAKESVSSSSPVPDQSNTIAAEVEFMADRDALKKRKVTSSANDVSQNASVEFGVNQNEPGDTGATNSMALGVNQSDEVNNELSPAARKLISGDEPLTKETKKKSKKEKSKKEKKHKKTRKNVSDDEDIFANLSPPSSSRRPTTTATTSSSTSDHSKPPAPPQPEEETTPVGGYDYRRAYWQERAGMHRDLSECWPNGDFPEAPRDPPPLPLEWGPVVPMTDEQWQDMITSTKELRKRLHKLREQHIAEGIPVNDRDYHYFGKKEE